MRRREASSLVIFSNPPHVPTHLWRPDGHGMDIGDKKNPTWVRGMSDRVELLEAPQRQAVIPVTRTSM